MTDAQTGHHKQRYTNHKRLFYNEKNGLSTEQAALYYYY